MPGKSGVTSKAPTLETVAVMAKVSRSTVSRVINGSPLVSPEVRSAVQDAIERLGYVPNRAARSLVTRRTDSIALVVREAVEFGIADPYLSSMIIAASQSLAGSGMHLAVMMARNDAEHSHLATYVRSGHFDGVMLISVHDDDPLPGQLARARIPIILGGRPATPLPGVEFVDVDNIGGAQMAVRHLLGRGRQRVAHIAGPTDMTAAIDRLAGFRTAMREAGQAPDAVAFGRFLEESGETAMHELISRNPDIDAVFVANDLMALGAMRALKQSGRRVPDDVAVIGFDDIEYGRHTEPTLTTIHQPVAEQAQMMTEHLVALIGGAGTAAPTTLPTYLVERESA